METQKKPINILVATGLYPPDIGGPATYTKMLEEVLPQQGITLTVVPFGRVRHLPKLIRHVVYFFILLKILRKHDLVYALDPVSVGLPAFLAARLARKPFVVRLGGDYAWEQGRQRFGVTETLDQYTEHRKLSPIPVRLLAAVQSFVVRRARKIIVPSNYMKSIVSTWGVKENRIATIYSALHPIKVNENYNFLRNELNLKGSVIVTSGRLVPWKGVSKVIEVIAKLKFLIPDISLMVIGEGNESEKLESLADNLGISESVRFTGQLDKKALGKHIKAADVFVLNTGYEGLSHQLLEVMDLGVPVVTTNVGGNTELVEHKVTGLLTDYNDTEAIASAITKLLKDSELKDKLVQQARLRTHDFDQHNITKRTISMIKQTVYGEV